MLFGVSDLCCCLLLFKSFISCFLFGADKYKAIKKPTIKAGLYCFYKSIRHNQYKSLYVWALPETRQALTVEKSVMLFPNTLNLTVKAMSLVLL